MKPAAFTYCHPETVEEALDLLADVGPDAKVLAGGQSLMPLMNFRLAEPEYLIDINGIAALEGVERTPGQLRLGALTRHRHLERKPEIYGPVPLFGLIAPHIGHPQIRVRGTMGGSLAHADPSAELPGAMVALDATMVVRSKRGERRVAASDFFQFHLTTDLTEDELLVGVEVPLAPGQQGSGFQEVAARFGDFAAVGANAVLQLDDAGLVAQARIVCIAVDATPVRVEAAEELLVGKAVDAGLLAEVDALVAGSLDPSPQLKVSAAYKRRTAGVLVRRALQQAWDNAHDATEEGAAA